ncbi:hypothetical protein LNJ05_12325 [Tenacibaculum finnmarkense genomovar ulcerans]|uniref:hypothetical protein n=1 Tax=Tenacibaculum finnmarkense TaxID=2781243 RepID=UPI001E39FE2B|nr:hypothetical protein [Tenacibaculum finnmarkense]MCD8433548.1 hypothetical protein [Tenacibaculum finnmarkense genomovar ulcerans]MCG8734776.1 hypothetical protein [Tenacibaculum finnmarkense]WCC41471.1 hypothetical protein PJJ26_08205 [Tenacibaculum finnmarkense]
MKFNQYLGKYVCGNLSEMDYPKLGVAGIIEGYKSKYLGILAGMNRTDEISELRKYLKWTIEELNIDLPKKRDAALLYSSGIVNEILNKEKDVIEGIYEIKNFAIDSYPDFRTETKKYLFDSIAFDGIYGLFVEYYDLNDCFEKKSNRNLMSKIKNQLLTEIGNWELKLKNGV